MLKREAVQRMEIRRFLKLVNTNVMTSLTTQKRELDYCRDGVWRREGGRGWEEEEREHWEQKR